MLTIVLIVTGSASTRLFLPSGSEALPLAEHIIDIASSSLVCTGVMMTFNNATWAVGLVVLPLVAMSVAFYPARLMFYAASYPALGSETVWRTYTAGGVIGLLLTAAIYAFAGPRRTPALVPAS